MSHFYLTLLLPQFYLDLYGALDGECPPTAREKFDDPSAAFANTIYQMLAAARPLSQS